MVRVPRLMSILVFALSSPPTPQLAVVQDKRKRLLITLPTANLAAAGCKSALTCPDRLRRTIADVRPVVDQIEGTNETSVIPATGSP